MTPQQIEALKLALEALKLLTGAWQTFGALDYGDNAITAIKEVLADHAMQEVQRLGQEIEQEPVAWQWLGSAHFRKKLPKNADNTAWNPLYTAPPQRTWVGLTDEEFHDLQIENIDDPWANFKAIEAKLKEKNT